MRCAPLQAFQFVLYAVMLALTLLAGLVAVMAEDEKQRRDARRVLIFCVATVTAAWLAPAIPSVIAAAIP